MRTYLPLFTLLVALTSCVSAIAFADEQASQTTKPQYLIELSEYSLKQPITVGLPESDVVTSVMNADVRPIETIRLTATAETESMVQIGKRVSVTTDTMTRGDTTTRRFKDLEIGTMLQVQIKPHDKGAIADVSYSTSRIDGPSDGDTPPSVLTNTVHSTQIYELGKHRLLTTSGADHVTAIIVTVRLMPNTQNGG